MPLAIQENENVKPYVRFERIAVDDPVATLAAGHYVAKDIDMVLITPPCSKDIMKYKVPSWFTQLAVDAANGRVPPDWVEGYKKAYEAWKNGQELPLDGIPIKGWGVASPAQQETLIKMHILTVEQLAAVNDEGIRRIGMGGLDLKNKAEAWLKSLKKSGGVAIQIAALKKENESLTATIGSLENKINELTLMVEHASKDIPIQALASLDSGISADDLIGD